MTQLEALVAPAIEFFEFVLSRNAQKPEAIAKEVREAWGSGVPHLEQEAFKAFLGKLCELDTQKQLGRLVWQNYPQSIRVLLDNPYVFQSYWDYQRGQITETQWKERFDAGKHRAAKALGSNDTAAVLGIVFNRLYTLRNQLMHGGATWNSSINRDQMRDCVKVLGDLVPVTISIMLDSPDTLWGDAVYPVVMDG